MFCNVCSVGSLLVLTNIYVPATVYDLHRYTLKATFHPNEPAWADVFKSAQSSCPNVLQLIDLLLSLPASSADCERGFSLTKVIKSDFRSRLRDTTVTNLVKIQLHSPDIEDFDPMPAIHRWKGKCKRRRSDCSNSDASNTE